VEYRFVQNVLPGHERSIASIEQCGNSGKTVFTTQIRLSAWGNPTASNFFELFFCFLIKIKSAMQANWTSMRNRAIAA